MTGLALVGFGKWGVRMLDSVKGEDSRAKFSTIVTRSPERVAAEAKARGLKVLKSLEEAVADPSIEGIVLATPHSIHAEQVITCAAGKKGVFVEKPFALTRESCARALKAAADAGIVVAAGHNRRFLPAMARIKEMIASGELGAIMHIDTDYTGGAALEYDPAHWRSAPSESPAGGLAGSGIHMIDAIIGLAGPISDVFAVAVRRAVKLPIADTTTVLFTLQSGATASLTNIVATVRSFRVKVFGSEGAVELRGEKQLVITPRKGESRTETLPALDITRAELEAFSDALKGIAPYPITPAEILNGIATFEAVCQSAESGKQVAIER